MSKSLLVLIFSILGLTTISVSAQIKGCKDPYANNYNAAATQNDGSCMYNTTSYTPPLKVNPINSVLVESSGLQWAGNSLWSFNDSGGDSAIYRIDTLTNALLQTVHLKGTKNVDWEDIAFDGTYFYVGDFGNNADGARNDLKIYKFPFSAIPDYTTNPDCTIPASLIETINFSYSDQPLPLTPTTSNNTRYDCEAMVIDGGKIHLFTKNWIDFTTTHYVINSLQSGAYVLAPLEILNTTYLVTAADKAPNKPIIVLLGYLATVPGNHFMHILSDYNGNSYFNGNVRRIDLPNALYMGQSEGLTFRTDTYGYISNERIQGNVGGVNYTVNQMLHQFDISNLAPQYVLPLQLINFNSTTVNGTSKIYWTFDSPIAELQLQISNNSNSGFTVLNTFYNSQTGSFNYKTENGETYYRLAWKDVNGILKYSNTLSIKNELLNNANNFHLKKNGQLSFLLSGNNTDYAIRLTDVDGRILFEMPQQSYNLGSNAIKLSNINLPIGIVFLTMYNKEQTNTQKIHVDL